MSSGHTPKQRAALRENTKRAWREGKMNPHWSAERRAKNSKALMRYWRTKGSTTDRLLQKVDRSGGPDACWPWMGCIDSKGYGVYKTGGRPRKAHRLVYVALGGVLPDDKALLHHCYPAKDNPSCCNPQHLRVGTRQENTTDAAKKGQLRRGSHHYNAKLTEEAVAAMRARRGTGESVWKLAVAYGVSPSTVYRVVSGGGWKHVCGPFICEGAQT